ncbi:uncharacterized protein LOC106664112 [Cimex lectularius]|uniref:Uncharacterized protein n=1 Tax=Cimex lectularius TaxID=79782 RepID=A0A8I6TEY7_CIMLE|nr:uncharacterized protein LOC106664112 [Cimex lectularius]
MIKHLPKKNLKNDAIARSDGSDGPQDDFEENRLFKTLPLTAKIELCGATDKKSEKHFNDKSEETKDPISQFHTPEDFQDSAKQRQEKLSLLVKRIDAACEDTYTKAEKDEIKSPTSSNSSNIIEIKFNDNRSDRKAEKNNSGTADVLNVSRSQTPLTLTHQLHEDDNIGDGFLQCPSLNVRWIGSPKTSFEDLVTNVDFTPENLKKRLGDWLHGSGTISKLRSYFRGLVVTALDQVPYSPPAQQYCGIHESICLLVADFLLQNKMEFSICVFCTEIVSLLGTYNRLKGFASKLINQETVMGIKEPLMDCADVFFILNTFNIHPEGAVAKDILKRYYEDRNGSLLAVMLVVQLVDSWTMRKEYEQEEHTQILTYLSEYKLEFKNIVSKTFSKVQELKMVQTQANRLYKSELVRVRTMEAAKYDKMLSAYKERQTKLLQILSEFEKCMNCQKETFRKANVSEEEVLLEYANKLTSYFYELKEHMNLVEEKEKDLARRENELETKITSISQLNTDEKQDSSYIFPTLQPRNKSKTSLRRLEQLRRKRRNKKMFRHHLKDKDLSENLIKKLSMNGKCDSSQFCQTELTLPPDSLCYFRDKSPEMTFSGGQNYHPHSDCFQLHDENMQLRAIIFEQQKRIDSLTKRSQELISEVTLSRDKSSTILIDPLSLDRPRTGDYHQSNIFENQKQTGNSNGSVHQRQSELNNLALFELAINDAKNKCFSLKMEAEMVENYYDDMSDGDHALQEVQNHPLLSQFLEETFVENQNNTACSEKSNQEFPKSSMESVNIVSMSSGDSGSNGSLTDFLLSAKNATNSETNMIKNVVAVAKAAQNHDESCESDDADSSNF